MLDIKVRKINHKPVYYECKLKCYGAEFDFGTLDTEEAAAFADTFRCAADELHEAGSLDMLEVRLLDAWYDYGSSEDFDAVIVRLLKEARGEA